MHFTNRAIEWVNTASRLGLMSAPALRQVRIQAGNVARRVGATRIGRNHLEQALDELSGEEATHV